MPKLRVGVFMGGKSIEKEASFNSGRTICDHLDTSRYDIIPIYQTTFGKLYILPWQFLHRGKTNDFEHRLDSQAETIIWDELSSRVDFLYIAMHGRYAEDGILQGALELLGIPYLGSSRLTSALCMDKTKLKKILQYHGITTPKDIVLSAQESIAAEQHLQEIFKAMHRKKISFPCIVKPHNEGSSIGVTVVHEEKELAQAIVYACTVHPNKSQSVLIEERITGMEFSCITLVDHTTGKLLPLIPTEIVPDNGTEYFDYDQKYMPGRAHKYTPPRKPQKVIEAIQKLCVKIMTVLEMKTLSRIDGFVKDSGEIVIIDPNTFSGMAPSSFAFREAAEMNMSHTDLINHLIESDLKRYGIENKSTFSQLKERDMGQKIRIGVLLGGASHEREISLESGRNVCYKLAPQKYEINPLFVDRDLNLFNISQSQLVRNTTDEIAATLKNEQKISWHSLKEAFDFIFIGLHGGVGENGSVQGMLEMLDVPYNGSSVFASSLCMDKKKTAEYLHASGFDVPAQTLIHREEWQTKKKEIVTSLTKNYTGAFVVKPHDDGCSVMVFRAENEKDLSKAVELIFAEGKQTVLVEEFIAGMELTVGVLGNDKPKALPPSQTIATGGILSIEEKFLPGAGENQTPAPLPQPALNFVQSTIEKVFKTVGMSGYARIDCFYQTAKESPTKKERVVILEINSLPGLTPATCIFHQAAEIGLKPMEFIDQIVELGLAAHRREKKDQLMLNQPTLVSEKNL